GWYLGGQFASVRRLPRTNLAHVRADLTVSPWNPGTNGLVYAIAASGSSVYVGGQFTMVGGQTRHKLAAVNATTGAVTSWTPNPVWDFGGGEEVQSLLVNAGTVYVGGAFSTIGEQTRFYLAAVDAATGIATNWNPQVNGRVYRMR